LNALANVALLTDIKNVLLDVLKSILRADMVNKKYSPQRKTTFKWNKDGNLSEIDMLRVLEKISNVELTQCDLNNDEAA
tara:strand:+ start:464 stop:700 length:237 start_codon:yes stop_codon:yes gene_type:complete